MKFKHEGVEIIPQEDGTVRVKYKIDVEWPLLGAKRCWICWRKPTQAIEMLIRLQQLRGAVGG